MPIIGIIIIITSFLIFILTLFYTNLREHVKLILPITIAFGGLGYGLMIYDRLIELTLPGGISIKTLVQKTLERAEFVEKMEKIVLAQSETIGLVAKQANEMQPQILRVDEEVKKFEGFINDMRDNLQEEYQTVSDELARIKLLISLPILADKAISEGDREAFNELNRIAQSETEINPIKRGAIEEIRRVISNISNPSFIEPSLTVTLEDGTVKKDWDIPTSRLITSMSDQDWKVRAKSAMLLGFRREKGVPDILLQTARTDTHLRAVYHASSSFKYATRTGPRLAGEPSITPSEAIDMLDTDKLEQWWKEKAEEVNERLPEMKK